MENKTKCAFVSIIGQTNAGKSTLVNKIMDKKVSITSHKVQTTRFNIKGIVSDKADGTQLVFIDTPGNFNPRRKLDKAMISAIWTAVSDAEVIVLLVDAEKALHEKYKEPLLDGLTKFKGQKPIFLAFNKIDMIKREDLLELTAKYNESGIFDKTFMISATKGSGVADLVKALKDQAVESPWFYEDDRRTDLPNKLALSEITREQVYKYLHQELPYAINVGTDKIEELDNKFIIHQTIYVKRKTQKMIVVGKHGASLKRIGEKAREEMRRFYKKRINLFLFVKVKERWDEIKEFYDDNGLNF